MMDRHTIRYWDALLRRQGLGIGRGLDLSRAVQLSCCAFEAEDRPNPDLKDIIEYKFDHMEAA